MIICNRTGGGRVAFADKKAAFAYINEYQKEKYDRITVMASKGKKAEYQEAAKAAGMYRNVRG